MNVTAPDLFKVFRLPGPPVLSIEADDQAVDHHGGVVANASVVLIEDYFLDVDVGVIVETRPKEIRLDSH